MTASFGSSVAMRGDQPPAGAGEPRHHRADRHLGHFRDLPVVEALHVTQHQRFAERQRQLRDRGFEAHRIGLGDQRRLRRFGRADRARRRPRLLLLDGFEIVDHEQRRRAVLAQPGIGGVAHDGQQPGPGIDPGKAADPAKGPQASLLHHVLGIGAIAGEPARERVGVGEVRQHHAARSAPDRRRCAGSPSSMCTTRDHTGRDRSPTVLFPGCEWFLTRQPWARRRRYSAACMPASMKPPDWRRHSAA